MRLGPRAIVLSLLLALMVNFTGLYVLLRINEHVRPKKKKGLTKVHQIDFLTQKKKKRRRRRVRAKLRQLTLRQAPLPVPNLPSSIQAPGLLLPEVSAARLIRPVFDQELTRDVRLIFKEEEVDERPRVLSRVAPRYPEAAADQSLTGWVQFKLLVNRLGRVEKVFVLSAKPRGVFEEAAKRAIKRWVFSPARYRGQNVSVWFKQRIIFSLQED